MGGNDNFIKDYLIYLEQKAQDFDSVNTDWVFFKGFAGRNTNDLHKKFVTHYPKLQRKKDVGDFDGKCSVCGKAGKIRYPDLPFFAVGISNYAHNLKTDHSAFRIRICSDCEPYIAAGWKYVNDLFRGKFYALVPKLRDETTTKDSLESFVKLVNNNLSNFEKLNNVPFSNSKGYSNSFLCTVKIRGLVSLSIFISSTIWVFPKTKKCKWILASSI
jgi:hypothetical protein